MNNRYLMDKARRRMDRNYSMRDSRNPYGSRGGYVVSSRGRGRDRAMDSGYPYPEYDSRDYRMSNYDYRGGDYHYGYEQPREPYRNMEYAMYGSVMPMDYRGGYDRRMDYRDYGSGSEEKEYEEKLHHWAEKLKKKDRFNWSKEQVIQQAKNMGVQFKEYDEMEFYVTFLMMMSDYPTIANEPRMYLTLAKQFLEDDDAKLKGSDKLCAYMYTIVLGEED